ncbi:HRDC domain-containing protein [Roseinatronobacter sp.]
MLTLSPATLRAISETRPASLEALSRIKGMDAARVERFGQAIVQQVQAE